jgi:hypothetical protein
MSLSFFRRGQTWSVDLAISLVMFTLAVLIAYGVIQNTLHDSGYEDVRRQAQGASSILVSSGYPAHWTNDTVIRAGLAGDGVLSLRKARSLNSLSYSNVRKTTRMTDDISISIRNASDEIIPLFGACAIGGATVSSTPGIKELPAIAFTQGSFPVTTMVASRTNLTLAMNDDGYQDFMNNDIVIIEGNISANSNLSSLQAARVIEAGAQRGMTVLVIGDPGAPVLGIEVNVTNASTATLVDGRAVTLGFGVNQTLNLTSLPTPLATIEAPVAAEASDYHIIGITDQGKTAIATWLYNDARVWYIATSTGTLSNGTTIASALASAAEQFVVVSWPHCGELEIPSEARHIARYDRTIAYHDQFLTLRIITWRTR